MSNTPDEAERLIEELIRADRDYVMAYKPSFRADAEALRQRSVSRLEAIRSQLLPLIRSGLAMQRLENARPAAIKILPDPAGGWIGTIEHPRHHGHSSAGDTIPDAINAALDAAGVEK